MQSPASLTIIPKFIYAEYVVARSTQNCTKNNPYSTTQLKLIDDVNKTMHLLELDQWRAQ